MENSFIFPTGIHMLKGNLGKVPMTGTTELFVLLVLGIKNIWIPVKCKGKAKQ